VRIIYFADIRFPLERANGIQTMETCHALATRGHVVQLVVRPDTVRANRDALAYYGLPPVGTLTIESAPTSGPPWARRIGYLAFAAGRVLGRGRADVVLTRDLGVAAALIAIPRGLRPGIVYESHGYAPDVAAALPELVPDAPTASAAKLRRLARREAQVWRRAEGYVTITKSLADYLTERLGARDRLAIAPDGVRLDDVHQPDAQEHDTSRRPVVAYAGHLYRWKGVDVLIDALTRVPEADGLIIGGHEREPDLARLKALAEQMNVGHRVTFTGMQPPREVPKWLARADVLVLPNTASAISTRFTSPLKLFEYMAAGRGIVASDLPAIREVLGHEQNALLVRPGDPDALARAIQRLIGDPALRARLVAAALAEVREYAWSRRAIRLESLLEEAARVRR
jgi:glycosyltransferase involved in cell wall biosynthesis